MEYIVGIAVIAAIGYLLTRKKKEAVAESAPYKVEAKVEAVNAQPVTETKTAAPAKKAAPKKAPAKAPAKAKTPAKPKATTGTKPKRTATKK